MAHQVKQQGDQLTASYQAWQNQTAQATKGSGKNIRSAYNSFRDFYDQEKEFRNIFVPHSNKKRRLSMAEMNRRINIGGG